MHYTEAVKPLRY